jgi:5'-3' exonuclease
MILVDLNQVMISNLMQQVGNNKAALLEEDLVRHMVLNSLRMYRTKFSEKFGELVICCDDKNNWRRDVFPYYKVHRKKARQESALDWNTIFSFLNSVKEDLKNKFPYKVLQVPRAEADDIIGSICTEYGQTLNNGSEEILILSSDKDFGQLQKYANVQQYSPVQKKYIRINNPATFINEHILKGDRGDGVPNFLSDDDTFVNQKRQKPLTYKKLSVWNVMKPEDFCNEKMLRGYKRNQQLIDLNFIPKDIYNQAIEQFVNYKCNDRSLMFNYFIDKKLKNLMEVIREF